MNILLLFFFSLFSFYNLQASDNSSTELDVSSREFKDSFDLNDEDTTESPEEKRIKNLENCGLTRKEIDTFLTQEKKEQKKSLNIMILGDIGVGKSTLIHKFLETHSYSPFTTIGLKAESKRVTVNGKSIKINIWDTGGGEFFFNLCCRSLLTQADGFILMGDLQYYAESIKSLSNWERKIKKYNRPILRVYNKVNAPHPVKDFKTPISYVDLDQNHFIQDSFHRLIHMILEKKGPSFLED